MFGCANVFSLKTTISPTAPIKERRRLMSELIATETVDLYRRTGHQELTIDAMRRRYDEIVPTRDRWWLSEGFYSWLVEYAIH